MAVKAESDLFLPDSNFDVPLATDTPVAGELAKIAAEHPELVAPPRPSAEPETPPEPDVEILDIDGGTITYGKDDKGWFGELQLDDGGGTEVFRGKTQKELMSNVLQGKAKATAQIRKLNKRIKLGGKPTVEPVAPVPPQDFQPNTLSANDIFEIKTALEADPDKAADLRFQKKYGMTEADFVSRFLVTEKKAEKGEEAHEELSVEGVAKEFLDRNQNTYYPWEENGNNMVAWLVKHKLGRQLTSRDNFNTVAAELLKKNQFTVELLEEAMEDLSDSGLLTPPPVAEPEETPAPQPVRSEQPANPEPRIASTRRQPRAAHGIRPSTLSTREPEPSRAPSADELDNMSQEELNKLYRDSIKMAQIQKYGARR